MTQLRAANGALRRARVELNLGQAEFAAAINRAGADTGDELRCDVRLVAKWEAGETRWPQGRYRRALEAVTGQPCARLGFQPPAGRTATWGVTAASTVSSTSDVEDPVQRREFLVDTAGLAAFLAAPGPRGQDRRVTTAYVEGVRQTLTHLQDLERRFGSGQLLPLAEVQVEELAVVLDTGADAPDVQAVAAWAHVLAGWMNYDAGKQGRARYLLKEGLLLAQMAGDDGMVARAAAVMSMQAATLGRGREAVQLARLGGEHTPPGGRVTALLAMREARGWSQLQAEREADAALMRAADAHPHGRADPEWAGFFTEAEMAGAAAKVASDLGSWRRAEALSRRAASDPSLPLRARVSWALFLAETQVEQGGYAEAADTTAAVLPGLERVSSDRVRAQVRRLAALPAGNTTNAAALREHLEPHTR